MAYWIMWYEVKSQIMCIQDIMDDMICIHEMMSNIMFLLYDG